MSTVETISESAQIQEGNTVVETPQIEPKPSEPTESYLHQGLYRFYLGGGMTPERAREGATFSSPVETKKNSTV